jgi:DNA modification methylase
LLAEIPDNTIKLIITSPPYNLGKNYKNKVSIEHYLETQSQVITQQQYTFSWQRKGNALCGYGP